MSEEARIQQIEQYAAEHYGASGLFAGFVFGAKWADNNPDLSLLWHDADDEPEDGSDVLLIDSEHRAIAFNIGKVCYYEAYGLLGWPAYVANYDVKRWAYISDLLPRDTFSNEKS